MDSQYKAVLEVREARHEYLKEFFKLCNGEKQHRTSLGNFKTPNFPDCPLKPYRLLTQVSERKKQIIKCIRSANSRSKSQTKMQVLDEEIKDD